MRVAVVTPFYQTPVPWLEQCHASVRAQTHPCTHFLVSDGSGDNPLTDFEGEFIRLPKAHADNGNTPRAVGSVAAAGGRFDAIAYLDADNWLAPDHVESLVRCCRESGANICTSGRTLHGLDGDVLGDCHDVDGINFADTSCLFITRPAFWITLQWVLMPRAFSPVCDFWVWSAVRKSGQPTAHTGRKTMAFRTSYPHHFQRAGRPVPEGCKSQAYLLDVRDKIQALARHFGEHAAAPAFWRKPRPQS